MEYVAPAYYGDLDFIKNDGTKPLRPDGSAGDSTGNRSSLGRVLATSSVYVVPFGTDSGNSPSPSQTYSNQAHIKWDVNFAGTITIEAAGFPGYILGRERQGGSSQTDLTDYDTTTKGGWMSYSPTGTLVSVTSTDGTTGGGTITVTAGTLTQIVVAGGTAGGAMISLGGSAARRLRAKFASITTGGTVRMATNGKLGG